MRTISFEDFNSYFEVVASNWWVHKDETGSNPVLDSKSVATFNTNVSETYKTDAKQREWVAGRGYNIVQWAEMINAAWTNNSARPQPDNADGSNNQINRNHERKRVRCSKVL